MLVAIVVQQNFRHTSIFKIVQPSYWISHIHSIDMIINASAVEAMINIISYAVMAFSNTNNKSSSGNNNNKFS